jgi:hypothetical protein
MHIYNDGRIHVQTGVTSNYTKFDLNPSDSDRKALQRYFDCQVGAGNYGRSFADTDTKYVPVVVEEKVVTTRIVKAIAPAVSISVSA